MKLLTICIPTYKRAKTLLRCIDSAVSQIEELSLSGQVGVLVADDASPDDTAGVLRKYQECDFFRGVTRRQNLGMNVNIKTMFEEAESESVYQLIVTDDDYLQPGILGDLVQFLQQRQESGDEVPAIWTPRYSYTEDGDLHCIVCNPFQSSRKLEPSAGNAGKYMDSGFVLSGLILRADCIDFEFWDSYSNNAYFPMICLGDLLYRYGAHYWNSNIVHHTVLNECHWESWGENDIVIEIKLFIDYVNAYSIMASRIGDSARLPLFYLFSFRGIYGAIKRLLVCDKWKGNEAVLVETIRRFKAEDIPRFAWPLRLIMVFAFMLSVISISLRPVYRLKNRLMLRGSLQGKRFRPAIGNLWAQLSTAPTILRLILSPPK